MSRIGYKEIKLPKDVQVSQSGNVVTVKGPKGTLSREISPLIKMTVDDDTVKFDRGDSDDNQLKMIHGTTRANVNNMVEGVTKGYTKILQLVGVGYRAQMKGKTLVLSVGYSHPVEMQQPDDLEVKVEKGNITISGCDKQHVGDFAAEVRAVRAPEPYKGKGIRYMNEHIIRKEGKTGK
ncbi:50S ribosomal protein L6 [Limosilactobacillus difficilis]|uniref:50S ribosomal protein L6 n=1 Tax=Limosilactobacillus difficilis TaxID=2991838 RepID=UPI0024B9AB2C|nr:50S ribosomal protein L6 [Limosilactobacillus difficilis]